MIQIAATDERPDLKNAKPGAELLRDLQPRKGIVEIDTQDIRRRRRFQHSVVRRLEFANQPRLGQRRFERRSRHAGFDRPYMRDKFGGLPAEAPAPVEVRTNTLLQSRRLPHPPQIPPLLPPPQDPPDP